MPCSPPPQSQRSSSLSWYILSLQLGPTRGNNSPAFTFPLDWKRLTILPSLHLYSVPLVSFLMLASGIQLPMSVIFNAFKCMGYFSYVHFKKTGFASYYLNKQKVLSQLSLRAPWELLKSWNCHGVSASKPLPPSQGWEDSLGRGKLEEAPRDALWSLMVGLPTMLISLPAVSPFSAPCSQKWKAVCLTGT